MVLLLIYDVSHGVVLVVTSLIPLQVTPAGVVDTPTGVTERGATNHPPNQNSS